MVEQDTKRLLKLMTTVLVDIMKRNTLWCVGRTLLNLGQIKIVCLCASATFFAEMRM